jgi:CheY-like chemotaxis protein
MLVLLVEDHEDTREATTMFLKTQKVQVEMAVTGLQALALARRIKPDVIVMDLGLPGMDGWEATRQLKWDPATQRIPIVALSAHATDDDEHRAREAGCDVYLRKPCHPSQLLEAIFRFDLGRR